MSAPAWVSAAAVHVKPRSFGLPDSEAGPASCAQPQSGGRNGLAACGSVPGPSMRFQSSAVAGFLTAGKNPIWVVGAWENRRPTAAPVVANIKCHGMLGWAYWTTDPAHFRAAACLRTSLLRTVLHISICGGRAAHCAQPQFRPQRREHAGPGPRPSC